MIHALAASPKRYTVTTKATIAPTKQTKGTKSLHWVSGALARTAWSAVRCASLARNGGSVARNVAAVMPTSVEQAVASSVVGKMTAGSTESYCARRPIMPVGRRASALVLIAKNRTIAFVAVPLPC